MEVLVDNFSLHWWWKILGQKWGKRFWIQFWIKQFLDIFYLCSEVLSLFLECVCDVLDWYVQVKISLSDNAIDWIFLFNLPVKYWIIPWSSDGGNSHILSCILSSILSMKFQFVGFLSLVFLNTNMHQCFVVKCLKWDVCKKLCVGGG